MYSWPILHCLIHVTRKGLRSLLPFSIGKHKSESLRQINDPIYCRTWCVRKTGLAQKSVGVLSDSESYSTHPLRQRQSLFMASFGDLGKNCSPPNRVINLRHFHLLAVSPISSKLAELLLLLHLCCFPDQYRITRL